MNAILTNWKTSLAGAGVILGALADLATHLSTGNTSTLGADLMTILSGLGLVGAHDATTPTS